MPSAHALQLPGTLYRNPTLSSVTCAGSGEMKLLHPGSAVPTYPPRWNSSTCIGELPVAPSMVINAADSPEQIPFTVGFAPTAGNAHFHAFPGPTSTGANVAAAFLITAGSGLHG